MTIHEAMVIINTGNGFLTDGKIFKTFKGASRHNRRCGFNDKGDSLNPSLPTKEELEKKRKISDILVFGL